ncbi:toxin-antitoxin system HicB family antitoxin [Caballeronia insecticola]|uniref:toxin-antitoxin system HicB family antitoxin n=1 Tax=Caballeronia insecticola TaxID=758793 RepID=UPI0005C4CB6D|nr:toxin-antitoxin system HicB family antitoxin [Caballeronia insecticola]
MSMKRIINGKSYNTATANCVFEIKPESHTSMDWRASQGWWGLYQTRDGEFFQIMVDHDGETLLEFAPVTDGEALKLLEKHADHLVAQYFGEMPEGGASERRLTIRIPGNLADRLETIAKAQGQSLNTYAMRCFERCVAADGQPAING